MVLTEPEYDIFNQYAIEINNSYCGENCYDEKDILQNNLYIGRNSYFDIIINKDSISTDCLENNENCIACITGNKACIACKYWHELSQNGEKTCLDEEESTQIESTILTDEIIENTIIEERSNIKSEEIIEEKTNVKSDKIMESTIIEEKTNFQSDEIKEGNNIKCEEIIESTIIEEKTNFQRDEIKEGTNIKSEEIIERTIIEEKANFQSEEFNKNFINNNNTNNNNFNYSNNNKFINNINLEPIKEVEDDINYYHSKNTINNINSINNITNLDKINHINKNINNINNINNNNNDLIKENSDSLPNSRKNTIFLNKASKHKCSFYSSVSSKSDRSTNDSENFGSFLSLSNSNLIPYERNSIIEKNYQLILNIKRIIILEDRRTSLIIKNIPNKFNGELLLNIIDQNFKNA